MSSNSIATLPLGTQEWGWWENGRQKRSQKDEVGKLTYLNPYLQRKEGGEEKRTGGRRERGWEGERKEGKKPGSIFHLSIDKNYFKSPIRNWNWKRFGIWNIESYLKGWTSSMLLDLTHNWEKKMLIPLLSTKWLIQLIRHDQVDSSQKERYWKPTKQKRPVWWVSGEAQLLTEVLRPEVSAPPGNL